VIETQLETSELCKKMQKTFKSRKNFLFSFLSSEKAFPL